MLDEVKLYSGTDLPSLKGGYVCRAAWVLNAVVPLAVFVLASIILIAGIQKMIPLMGAIIFSPGLFLFAVLGFNNWRSQKPFRKWILCLKPSEILINVGKPNDVMGHTALIIGIPISQLEWVRKVSSHRSVLVSGRRTTEEWDYLDLKTKGFSANLSSVLGPRVEYLGISTDASLFSIKEGIVRILWLSPFFNVRPDLDHIIQQIGGQLKTAPSISVTIQVDDEFSLPMPTR